MSASALDARVVTTSRIVQHVNQHASPLLVATCGPGLEASQVHALSTLQRCVQMQQGTSMIFGLLDGPSAIEASRVATWAAPASLSPLQFLQRASRPFLQAIDVLYLSHDDALLSTGRCDPRVVAAHDAIVRTVRPFLKRGALIVIDADARGIGACGEKLRAALLAAGGAKLLFDEYQVGFVIERPGLRLPPSHTWAPA